MTAADRTGCEGADSTPDDGRVAERSGQPEAAPASTGDGRAPRAALRAVAAFIVYVAAAILLWGLPVLAHFSTRYLANGRGDADFYRWSLAWTPWALVHGQSPLFTDRVFAPGGAGLTWSAIMPGPAIVMWPVTWVFGTLASHNLLKLLAPALAGWAAYLVCQRVTRSFWPSLIGGYLFGFSAYMVGQMQSHLNLVLVFPIPLAVYLVIRFAQGSIGRVAFTGLLALALLGLFSISTELFATTTVFGAIAFVLAFVSAGMDRIRIAYAALLTGTAIAIVAALLFAPYVLPAIRNSPPETIRTSETAAADALGFLVPRRDMLIRGGRVTSISRTFTANVIEDGSYIGIALILAIVGFAITERRRRGTWALLAFIAIGMVLSLGPVLHVKGEAKFHLPGALLANAPLMKHATAQRLPLYTSLAVAVLGAIWLARADHRTGWIRWTIVVGGALMLLPQLRNPDWYPYDRTPAFFTDGTYATVLRPDENVVLVTEKNAEEMLWQSQADFAFRMPEGYIGPIPTAYESRPLSQGLAVDEANRDILLPFMRFTGTTAIVMVDEMRSTFGPLLDSAGLSPVYEGDGVSVWR